MFLRSRTLPTWLVCLWPHVAGATGCAGSGHCPVGADAADSLDGDEVCILQTKATVSSSASRPVFEAQLPDVRQGLSGDRALLGQPRLQQPRQDGNGGDYATDLGQVDSQFQAFQPNIEYLGQPSPNAISSGFIGQHPAQQARQNGNGGDYATDLGQVDGQFQAVQPNIAYLEQPSPNAISSGLIGQPPLEQPRPNGIGAGYATDLGQVDSQLHALQPNIAYLGQPSPNAISHGLISQPPVQQPRQNGIGQPPLQHPRQNGNGGDYATDLGQVDGQFQAVQPNIAYLGQPSPNAMSSGFIGQHSPQQARQNGVGGDYATDLGQVNSQLHAYLGQQGPNAMRSGLIREPPLQQPRQNGNGGDYATDLGQVDGEFQAVQPNIAYHGQPSPNAISSGLIGQPPPQQPRPNGIGAGYPTDLGHEDGQFQAFKLHATYLGQPSPNAISFGLIGQPPPQQPRQAVQQKGAHLEQPSPNSMSSGLIAQPPLQQPQQTGIGDATDLGQVNRQLHTVQPNITYLGQRSPDVISSELIGQPPHQQLRQNGIGGDYATDRGQVDSQLHAVQPNIAYLGQPSPNAMSSGLIRWPPLQQPRQHGIGADYATDLGQVDSQLHAVEPNVAYVGQPSPNSINSGLIGQPALELPSSTLRQTVFAPEPQVKRELTSPVAVAQEDDRSMLQEAMAREELLERASLAEASAALSELELLATRTKDLAKEFLHNVSALAST